MPVQVMGLAFNRPCGLIAPTSRFLWVGDGHGPLRTLVEVPVPQVRSDPRVADVGRCAMTTLSRKERRALHRMERALREDDPQWVSSFDDAGLPHHDVIRVRVCAVFLSLAAALILAALGLDDRDMFVGGMTVLGSLPLVIVLMVLVDKNGRP
jgi:hypothetical protein